MSQNRTYIFLTLLLIALSVAGLIYFYQRPVRVVDPLLVTTLPTTSPTPSLQNNTNDLDQNLVDQATPVPITPTAVPTPTFNTLSSDQYGFTAIYSLSRKLYQTAEGSGTRFTLYSSQGNITVHAGPRWSWLHPGREFSQEYLVAGQPTFVYKISTQTIIDFDHNNNHITIQCVHGGNQTIVRECQQFVTDFQLSYQGS